jgi:hypothetical protein
MRQVGGGIGDAVDIEEHRAGNVAGEIFSLRVAGRVGHVPAAVEHNQVGIAEVAGQPVGGDERVVHGGLLISPPQ